MKAEVNINGFGDYTITNEGLVYSLDYKRPRRLNCFGSNKKQLKSHLDKKGYPKVRLLKDGKFYNFCIHRLVAEHFVNNPNNKPIVNHKDGNKQNNYYTNLEWTTYSENSLHAATIGLNKICKIVIQKDLFGKILNTFCSASEASRRLKIDKSGIAKACRKDLKSCGGFIWDYHTLDEIE